MANSVRNLWLGGLAAATSSLLAAQDNAPREPLQFACKSLALDRRTNLSELSSCTITQGNLRIAADHAVATSTELTERSEWRFMGNVKITVGTLIIDADSAVFTFEHERLARGEIEGQPASFMDIDPAREKPISGGASKLLFDDVGRTLRMSGEAWINKDPYEIRGCDLIYDLDDERVTSGSAECGGFRFRVVSPDAATSAVEAPQ
jgi:lipopolysaccharide transport protein LptA